MIRLKLGIGGGKPKPTCRLFPNFPSPCLFVAARSVVLIVRLLLAWHPDCGIMINNNKYVVHYRPCTLARVLLLVLLSAAAAGSI